MALSYGKEEPPRDLRQYDDTEVRRMSAAAKEGSREAAIWGEVMRLRRVVERLVKSGHKHEQ